MEVAPPPKLLKLLPLLPLLPLLTLLTQWHMPTYIYCYMVEVMVKDGCKTIWKIVLLNLALA